MVVVAVPAAASNLNWRHLSLMNGWQSSESIYGTGDPSWARHNGIVYLAGSLHQASGSSTEFAVLPPAARPEHLIYVTVYTFGDTTGRIDIFPNGAIEARSAPAGNSGS